MEYEFRVVMQQDQGTTVETTWANTFDNALDAVKCYERFVDHGTCVLDRVITLTEPNGRVHRKEFRYPHGSEAAYELACDKWRNQQFDPLLAVK